jgi:hypothetical protein
LRDDRRWVLIWRNVGTHCRTNTCAYCCADGGPHRCADGGPHRCADGGPRRPTAAATAAPILKTDGKGDKVVKIPAQDAPTIALVRGTGEGHFAITAYKDAEYAALLVNTIGKYAGTTYVEAGVNRLKLEYSGPWTIEIDPISAARPWDGTDKLTGKGDSVVLLTGGASGATTITSDGKQHFAVTAYSPEGDYLDLLVNEIGKYSGEVLLPNEDTMVLEIVDEGGNWTITAVTH